MGTDWQAAWSTALDALELDVATVEAQLVGEHAFRELPATDPWRPPEGLGPLPLDLRPRVDGILARQIAASQALSRAIAANRQQATMLHRLHDNTHHTPRPAYVDCAM